MFERVKKITTEDLLTGAVYRVMCRWNIELILSEREIKDNFLLADSQAITAVIIYCCEEGRDLDLGYISQGEVKFINLSLEVMSIERINK